MSISASPVHSIHEYANGIYKVVTFKGSRDPDNAYLRTPDATQHYDNKLDNSFSRARNMVLQYALCNSWDYFFTGTIDRAKFDRFNLDAYQSRLSQFVRDKRKKYQSQIQYLLGGYDSAGRSTMVTASPTTPANVTLGTATAGKNGIVVTWSYAADARTYRVYRKAPGDTKWVAVANVNGKSWTDKNVTSGVKYSAREGYFSSPCKKYSTELDAASRFFRVMPPTLPGCSMWRYAVTFPSLHVLASSGA